MIYFYRIGFLLLSAGVSSAWAENLTPNLPVNASADNTVVAAAVNPLELWKKRQAEGGQAPVAAPESSTSAAINAPVIPAASNVVTNTNALLQTYTAPAAAQPANTPKPILKQPLTYEQSREVMLNSVPEAKPPTTEESHTAFGALLEQNMPLSPRQMVTLRQQIDLAQRAAAVTPVIPPKPVSTTIMVNLAPGTTPPAVRLAQGYVSSLVFVDSTGAPWPVASFDVGNPKAVNIQWDGKGNILLIQAVSAYSNGDIVVRLVGLPTPVTLELVSGQRVVDYRVDLHVSGIGPNTKELPMGTSLPASANQLLLGVLDGIAPAGSKALMVKGADCQAWQLGENLYLRTRLTVLSPGWVGKMVSPDGMQAYELPKTSSVLVSRFGEPAELKIEGY